MSRSSFHCDGYRDAQRGIAPSPPSVPVFTAEYLEGYHRATDERTIAERKWAAPKLAAKPQLAMDIGLFGDEKDQLDLCEMFADPTNDS